MSTTVSASKELKYFIKELCYWSSYSQVCVCACVCVYVCVCVRACACMRAMQQFMQMKSIIKSTDKKFVISIFRSKISHMLFYVHTHTHTLICRLASYTNSLLTLKLAWSQLYNTEMVVNQGQRQNEGMLWRICFWWKLSLNSFAN